MPQPWDYIAKIVSLGDSGCGKSSLTIRLCEGRFSPHHDVTIGVEFGSRIIPVGPPASRELAINDPAGGNTLLDADAEVTLSTTKQTSKPTTLSASKATSTPVSSKPAAEEKQKHMKLSLWDTAGQETYRSITRSYFRGASGALLVFDITRRSTFASVTAWLNDLRQIAEEGIIIVLVGNKSDLAPSSTVSTTTAGEDHPHADAKNKREVTVEEAEEWCRVNKVMQYVETSAKSGEGVERAFREVAERIYQNIEAGKYDLNDRRSGVKSAATGGGGGGNTAKTVNLGMNDVDAAKRGKKGGGGCC